MKRKKISKKITKAIDESYYNNTPQSAGYLKPQKDIGSLEEIYGVKRVSPNTLKAQKILEESFGNTKKALAAIRKKAQEDLATKLLQKIREQTTSVQREIEKQNIKNKVTNPITGAVRKQKFKTAPITNKLADLITGKDQSYNKITKTEILPDGRKRHHIMYKPKHVPDEYMVMDFMWDNNILDVFGLVKFYKNNKKRYKLIVGKIYVMSCGLLILHLKKY